MASSKSSSSVQHVLQEVLDEKISHLKTQRTTLESYFRELRESARAQASAIEQIRVLHRGIQRSPVPLSTRDVLEGLPAYLALAEEDPSSSGQLSAHWLDILHSEISFVLSKCDYAYLFGEVMEEASGCGPGFEGEPRAEGSGPSAEGEPSTSGRERTIRELETKVFEAAPFDGVAFKEFLRRELLSGDSNIEVHEVMREVRENIVRRAEGLLKEEISDDDLGQCIDGLLGSDLLGEEKKKTLLWLKENKTSLAEMASLLTNRMKRLNEWGWPSEGVFVDVRRSMNGRHRAYLDERIPNALFLQYVGVRFCVLLRENLLTIYNSRIWKRRAGFDNENSIEHLRHELHRSNFLSLLPAEPADQAGAGYEAEKPAAPAMDVKNSLLHQLNTEARLHQVISPAETFTVVRTDLEWFGPSIPHQAIYEMLEFLGVPELWRNFFRRFLEVPMVFRAGEASRTRKRGVPIAHPLSTLCGECLLFLMDLYVNQASGVIVHRIHDDFWFWDRDEDAVCKAWEAMQRFASLSALRFNEEKSGSAKVLRPGFEFQGPPLVFGKAPLPQAAVKWSSLVFHSDAVFRVDLEALEPHIRDQKRQLRSARTVMEWVNVYNRYTAFFLRGFGEFACIFGSQHLDQVSKALRWIHEQVFEAHGGSALAALKSRFDVFQNVDPLDMWVYWPLELGGLGLRNAYLELAPLKEAMERFKGKASGEEPFFVRLPERDVVLWEESTRRAEREKEEKKVETFESYCAKRETELEHWKKEYSRGLGRPGDTMIDAFVMKTYTALMELDPQLRQPEFDRYATRVLYCYGNQLKQKFGTLQFVSPELIPRSLIASLKGAPISWDD